MAKPKRGRVLGVAFTVYPVKDMARARRFYEGGLGLKKTVDFSGRWVEYHLPNACFAITTQGGGYRPRSDSGQIAFEVDDVDAVVARLRARGAKVKVAPASGSTCRMAEVLDPEGNAVCIHAKHRAPRRSSR